MEHKLNKQEMFYEKYIELIDELVQKRGEEFLRTIFKKIFILKNEKVLINEDELKEIEIRDELKEIIRSKNYIFLMDLYYQKGLLSFENNEVIFGKNMTEEAENYGKDMLSIKPYWYIPGLFEIRWTEKGTKELDDLYSIIDGLNCIPIFIDRFPELTTLSYQIAPYMLVITRVGFERINKTGKVGMKSMLMTTMVTGFYSR